MGVALVDVVFLYTGTVEKVDVVPDIGGAGGADVGVPDAGGAGGAGAGVPDTGGLGGAGAAGQLGAIVTVFSSEVVEIDVLVFSIVVVEADGQLLAVAVMVLLHQSQLHTQILHSMSYLLRARECCCLLNRADRRTATGRCRGGLVTPKSASFSN